VQTVQTLDCMTKSESYDEEQMRRVLSLCLKVDSIADDITCSVSKSAYIWRT